ncbi:MAG: hypothetical protein P8X39_08855 [Desulfofustis sp.]|jgi:hypothetical protein
MADQASFNEQVRQFKQKVRSFEDTADERQIEETAVRLERLNYAPPVIIDLKKFLRLTKDTLLEEIDHILAMPDAEACALAPDNPKECRDLRLQFISVQIFYYEKLMLLRQGDIETWDEIDELYVHD